MFRFTNLIIFEITRDCNLHCQYCLQTDKDKFAGEMIDFDLFKNIIDKIIQEQILGMVRSNYSDLKLIFHGGEFLLAIKQGNFVKYLDYAYQRFKEFNVSVFLGTQTNGTLITDDVIKIFDKYQIGIGLSLDGFDGDNLFRIKNQNASDNYYKSLLKKLDQYKVEYGIINVISKQNIDHLIEFEKYIRENTSTRYTYLPLDDPHGDDNNEIYDQLFEKVYKRQIDDFVYGKKVDQKFTTKISMTFYDMLAYHRNVYASGCFGKICGTAISMISIRPDGKCGYCDRFVKDMPENYVKFATSYDFLGIHQLKTAIHAAYCKNDCILDKHCDFCRAQYICDYGCLSFTYSAKNKLEIEKRKVCDINLAIYDYIKDNLIELIKTMIIHNITIHFEEDFYEFKHEIVDLLFNNNIIVQKEPDRNIIKFQFKGENNG